MDKLCFRLYGQKRGGEGRENKLPSRPIKGEIFSPSEFVRSWESEQEEERGRKRDFTTQKCASFVALRFFPNKCAKKENAFSFFVHLVLVLFLFQYYKIDGISIPLPKSLLFFCAFQSFLNLLIFLRVGTTARVPTNSDLLLFLSSGFDERNHPLTEATQRKRVENAVFAVFFFLRKMGRGEKKRRQP